MLEYLIFAVFHLGLGALLGLLVRDAWARRARHKLSQDRRRWTFALGADDVRRRLARRAQSRRDRQVAEAIFREEAR